MRVFRTAVAVAFAASSIITSETATTARRALARPALTIHGQPSISTPDRPSDQVFRFTRTIDVDDAGWVRVPIGPEVAGMSAPDGRDVRVLDSDGRVVPHVLLDSALDVDDLDIVPLATEPGRAEFRLEHGGLDLVTSISLSFTGAGSAGYRLSEPAGGRWGVLSEGILQADAGRRIDLDAAARSSSERGATVWRLELFSAGDADLRVTGASATFRMRWLAFHADEATAHALAYGAVGLAPLDSSSVRPDVVFAAIPIAALGPEFEHDVPPADPRLAVAGTMPRAVFSAAWPVLGDGASPGDVVELEIEDAVIAASAVRLRDLRLDLDGRQVPFLMRVHPDPARVVSVAGLRPVPEPGSRQEGMSEIFVDLPYPLLPITEIELSTRALPFERDVVVEWIDRGRPSDLPGDPAAGRRMIAGMNWRCEGRSQTPCRLVIPAMGASTTQIRLSFDDGDDAPLDAVSVDVWRRRTSVRFVWPAVGAPTLRTGARELAAPTYDLAMLEPALAAMPARAVSLGAESGASGFPGSVEAADTWPWLPVASLAVAALVLLAILWRMLRADARGEGAVPPG